MKKIVLDPAEEGVLRGQVIDPARPGPVLHDFQVVLDHVSEKGLRASGPYRLLPAEVFGLLNEQLSRPVRLEAKPKLREHPYLQGLHLLLRASGLMRVEVQGLKGRLF